MTAHSQPDFDMMDTDRFVNELIRERSEACVFCNPEAERKLLLGLLAEKYDKYIERQKLRTTELQARSASHSSQKRRCWRRDLRLYVNSESLPPPTSRSLRSGIAGVSELLQSATSRGGEPLARIPVYGSKFGVER